MDITVFIILLFVSAFFSGSETAFLSLGKIKLRQIETLRHPAANRIVKLVSDTHKLLITILVGNTLVNIAASSIFAGIFYKAFGEKGVGLSIVAMILIILIFGEVTPKMYALTHAETVSFLASLPLLFFRKLFAPLRWILGAISQAIVRSLGLKIPSKRAKITEQEIKSLFSIGKEKGIVKEKERDMIYSILEFKDLNAADIMTPRIDMAALDMNLSGDELVKNTKEGQYSRLPVYVHTFDNIVGIIHAKDFLLNPDTPIKDIVKEPFFVPESMRIDDLLNQLQKRHIHMAIVTDEYGVTSGLVTIEDILEEIVGEIRDELDFEAPKIKKIDQKTYEVSGQAHINDVNEKLGLAIDTEEVDTIGGYVTLLMGKMPVSGDQVKINGHVAVVEDVSKNRITLLTIKKV
ncbi:MAG: hemolysin family protein [Candidatus Omnitrophota bacterium]